MKAKLFLTLIFLLIFLTALSAQVTNLRFNAEATVEGILELAVQLSNTLGGSLDTIGFGTITPNGVPTIAQDGSGNITYAKVIYGCNAPSGWDVRVYTDNENASANPQYTGPDDPETYKKDNGSGLVFDDGVTGTNSKSMPMRVWSDARFPTGEFARAQCLSWIGSGGAGNPWQGCPIPQETEAANILYWAINGEDLNNDGFINGPASDTPITNSGWTEAGGSGPAYDVHRPIDANGDGDTGDTMATLGGKVFENGWWLGVVGDDSVYPGAYTAVLDNSAIANGSRPSGSSLRAYFGVVGDVAGDFKTDHLFFEVKVR